MPVTLRDVAREAGFSVTTVSRALNGYRDVNERTRRHIEAVARRLGYSPNLAARQLQTRRAQTLGFVVPTPPDRLDEPFFVELLSSMSVEAARHEYDLLLSAHAPDAEEADTYRRLAGSGRVDGVLLARGRREDTRVTLLHELGLPFVLFGRTDDPTGYPWIDVDGEAGMRAVTEHLIALGHRRVGFVSGPPRYSFTSRRRRGYEAALRAAGVEPRAEDVVVAPHMTEREGYRAGLRLLARPDPPTAIVSLTDLLAYGVMRAVHESGRRVGQDVAVTGFDGLVLSAFTIPPLTTVAQPIAAIGRQLVRILLADMAGEGNPPQLLLQPELLVRESSTGQPGPAEEIDNLLMTD